MVGILSSHATADQPNIVLVMCDDLGWGDLQCYNGESKIKTPNLNAMAANGLKFNRFYAAAPVCSPTRGSVLTGRHPYRYGVTTANAGHLKKQEIALPEILRKQGYATGHFGKWHLGTLTTEIRDSNRGGSPKGKGHFSPPQQHGYDVCFVTEAKVPTHDPMIKPPNAGRKAWDAITDKSKAVSYGTRYWDERGEIVKENLDGDDSKIIMDRAIQFVRKTAKNKKPFLAVVWFHAPHLPVVASAEDVKPYAKYDVYRRNYYGCVAAIDKQMGRLRSELRQLGIADNTLLCFCSDNGPEGNSKAPGSAKHLRGRKRSLYEGGVRVPGIIEWPAKIKSSRTTNFPAVTSDYFPTIIDALGLKMPDKRPIDGVSLMPVISQKKEKRGTYIGFQHGNQKSFVGDRYKIYRSRNNNWQLYDLSVDLAETKDIASQQTDLVKQLTKQFQDWSNSCEKSSQGRDYPK